MRTKMNKLFNFLDNNTINYQMYGSKVISPSEPYNDIDYIALVEDVMAMNQKLIKEQGFVQSSDYHGKYFISYRKGEINLVITQDSKFYDCTVLATRLAHSLGCKTKQERIIVFESVMHPNGYDFNRNGKENTRKRIKVKKI